MNAWLRLAILGLGLWLAAPSASPASGGMCGPQSDPVLVVLVESAAKVAAAAAGLSKTPRLVNTADTVIYEDGRVVSSNLGSVSGHLNALGWANRPIEIAGAGTSTRLPPASTGQRRG